MACTALTLCDAGGLPGAIHSASRGGQMRCNAKRIPRHETGKNQRSGRRVAVAEPTQPGQTSQAKWPRSAGLGKNGMPMLIAGPAGLRACASLVLATARRFVRILVSCSCLYGSLHRGATREMLGAAVERPGGDIDE